MKIGHEELLLYASGELPPDRRARVEDTLRSDPEAQRVLAGFRVQEERWSQLPLLEPSRDLVAPALEAARRPRLLFFPGPLLAAAAILLLVGGGLWLFRSRGPAAQVARNTPPAEADIFLGDEELGARIARLRAALGGLVPGAAARAHEPASSAVAGLRDRLDALKDLCRPQVAATTSPRPGDRFDRRMEDLRSRLDTTREGLLKDLPAADEVARGGAKATIKLSIQRYHALEEPKTKPVCNRRSPS